MPEVKPQYQSTIIDGIELRIHDTRVPMRSFEDMHLATAVLNPKNYNFGISFKLTEITEGVGSMAIQQRLSSPYFNNKLKEWFEKLGAKTCNTQATIAQLSANVMEMENHSIFIGRLYGHGQHLFAKMELNRAWSVTMNNESSPLADGTQERGLWGSWKINEHFHGQFQIEYKRHSLINGARIPFTHCGKVASEWKTFLEEQIKHAFVERWGHLVRDEVKQDLTFEFDSSVVERSTIEGIFDELFSPFFEAFVTQPASRALPGFPVVNDRDLNSMSVILYKDKVYVVLCVQVMDGEMSFPSFDSDGGKRTFTFSGSNPLATKVDKSDIRILCNNAGFSNRSDAAIEFARAIGNRVLDSEEYCNIFGKMFDPTAVTVLGSAEGKTLKSMNLLYIDDQLHVVGYTRPVAEGLQLTTYCKLGLQCVYVIRSETSERYNPAVNYLKITDLQTLHFDKRRNDWAFSIGCPKELAIELDGVMPSEEQYMKLLMKYRSV